jgi:hypothetical protein
MRITLLVVLVALLVGAGIACEKRIEEARAPSPMGETLRASHAR